LSKESGVSEDREEVSESGEVVGDTTAVVYGRREVLQELANVHDSFSDADRATLFEVSNHVFDVSDESVSAVHAAKQVVKVICVQNAVHDTCEHSDNIDTVEGNSLVD
jgi:ribosomal protein L25 (general stress protein Ctc)